MNQNAATWAPKLSAALALHTLADENALMQYLRSIKTKTPSSSSTMVLDPARLLDLCHREVHAARCRAARFDEHLGFGDLAQRLAKVRPRGPVVRDRDMPATAQARADAVELVKVAGTTIGRLVHLLVRTERVRRAVERVGALARGSASERAAVSSIAGP